jgi:hypothetical protein
VVLCEVPPLIFEDDRIIPLNAAIAGIAEARGYPLVDYHTPMKGHPEFSMQTESIPTPKATRQAGGADLCTERRKLMTT